MRIDVNILKENPLNKKIYGNEITGETDLIEKIKETGYIKAILITDNNTIISGHRRVAACKKLNIKEIEAEIIIGKTDLELNELFLLENIARIKTTEQISNEYRMYKEIETQKALIRELAGKKVDPVYKKDTGSGKARDLAAKKIGKSSGNKLDDNLKTLDKINELNETVKQDAKEIFNSNVVAAKKLVKLEENKLEDVVKIIKNIKPLNKTKNADINSALKQIERKEKTEKASSLPKNEKILNGDAVEMLKTLKNESIDCVVTDPPYGVDYKDTRDVGHKLYKDEKDYALELLENTCKELKRVCVKGAHMYFFTGYINMFEFKQILSKYFHVQLNPIVWVKNNHTLCDFSKRYASKCEYIWFCHNSEDVERLLNNECSPDVIECSVDSDKNHSAQKPVELLKQLINNSTVENETVLDCFAGSGSTLIAAKNINRNYVGIEIDKEFCATIESRLVNE